MSTRNIPTLIYAIIIIPLSLLINESTMASVEQFCITDSEFNTAYQLEFSNPDSAIVLFKNYYNSQMSKGDTIKGIQALIELGELTSHFYYSDSYNYYWDALLLADNINSELAKGKIYQGIGILYNLYQRKSEALDYYLKSLKITQSLVKQDKLSETELVHNYYSLVIYYRDGGNIDYAKKYLDSCRYIQSRDEASDNSFIAAEAAFISYMEGDFNKAIKELLKLAPRFEQRNPSYLVIVYSFLGDAYRELNDFTNSKKSYMASIRFSEQYHSHIDFKIQSLNKLSQLYFNNGNYKQAYLKLDKAQQLDKELFGSKSSKNKSLLEIQDKYLIVKEYQDKLLQEKRISDFEHEERVYFFKNIILLGSIFIILLFSYMFVRSIRRRHKTSRMKISMEMRKAYEILEIKNRELASSTLQIIEKEKVLQEVKTTLKTEKDTLKPRDLDKLAKSIHVSSENAWGEFEARFISVNERFYDTLHDKYPKLTQGDHRLCALIKLNFSSKEMSNLLGISVESVHSSRYKLRKKLGLSRDMNLTEFIAKL